MHVTHSHRRARRQPHTPDARHRPARGRALLAAMLACLAAICGALTPASALADSTIGNPAIDRPSLIGGGALLVDATNPATENGVVTSFRLFSDAPYAETATARFVLIDGDDVVQYLSPVVSYAPSVGLVTYTPPVPVPVQTGWRVGVSAAEDGYLTIDQAGGGLHEEFYPTPTSVGQDMTDASFGESDGLISLEATVEPVATRADVSVAVTDSADPVSVGGDAVTYTVAVANGGPAAATGVSVATTVSGASAGISSASSTQGSCSTAGSTVTCSLGGLAASASATVTITVTPAATGTITATATVSATETDPAAGNNTDAESTTVNNNLGCTLTGTNGPDTLNGGNGSQVICGLGGNDTIDGGNGDDTIYAGAGNDTIGGGNGSDVINAGPGNDANYGETLLGSLLYLFDNGNDTINGGPGDDDIDGQNGNDTLTDTSGTDTMSGNNGSDNINVQDSVAGDTANGGLGSDSCTTDTGDTRTSC